MSWFDFSFNYHRQLNKLLKFIEEHDLEHIETVDAKLSLDEYAELLDVKEDKDKCPICGCNEFILMHPYKAQDFFDHTKAVCLVGLVCHGCNTVYRQKAITATPQFDKLVNMRTYNKNVETIRKTIAMLKHDVELYDFNFDEFYKAYEEINKLKELI